MRAIRGLLLMLTIVSVALGLSVVGAGFPATNPRWLGTWPIWNSAAGTLFGSLPFLAGQPDADRAMVAGSPSAHPLPVITWQIGPSRSPLEEDALTHLSFAHMPHGSDLAAERNDLRGFLYDMARATRFHNSIGITWEQLAEDRQDPSASADK